MITDKLLRVSDSQAVAATNADVISTDFINWNNIASSSRARDIGMGETLFALFTINTAPTAGTSIEFQIQVGTASGGSFTLTDTLSKRALGIAALPAGTQILLPIPPHSLAGTTSHAMRANYFCSGAIASAVITCDIILDAQQLSKYYPSGFTVYSA